jgi:hypothetical protein
MAAVGLTERPVTEWRQPATLDVMSTAPTHLPAAPPPSSPRRLWPVIAITAAVTALLAGGIGAALALAGGHDHASAATSPSPAAVSYAPEPFTVSATLLLRDSISVLNIDNHACRGMGTYTYLAPGAQIVITDETHTTVATGVLTAGTLIGFGATRQCRFGWTAEGVPAGHTFYQVQIVGRDGPQLTESDLRSHGLELTAG